MKNGYIITYYLGTQWIDQDLLLSHQDTQDHVDVAMEIGECDLITVHCIDNGDVLYTYELFCVEGQWVQFTNNQIMGIQSMVNL